MGAIDITADQMLWYIAFNEWVLISIPRIHEDMEQDLRTGRLAYLLPRPMSYLGSIFCESFGILIVNLSVLGTATCLFTWLYTDALPFGAAGLPPQHFLLF